MHASIGPRSTLNQIGAMRINKRTSAVASACEADGEHGASLLTISRLAMLQATIVFKSDFPFVTSVFTAKPSLGQIRIWRSLIAKAIPRKHPFTHRSRTAARSSLRGWQLERALVPALQRRVRFREFYMSTGRRRNQAFITGGEKICLSVAD